jgi:hypothetical protein
MAVGSTLLADRYELGRVLGGGRVGEVWEARDRMLGRRVAVKMAHARLAQDAAFSDAFLKAVREAAGLEHPGAVAVHDAGTAGRVPFVVMEYVDGRTVREVVRHAGPMPPARAARLVAEVASALAAAHTRGLGHGGLHAGNIFLTPTGQAKLADLGLARLATPGITAATGPVANEIVRAWDPRQGPVTGTVVDPAHGAADGRPEQAGPAGHAGPAGRQSSDAAAFRDDLIAIGGLLYELLSGRPADQAERRPLRAARRDVPPELDGIVRNALAGRYRSAVEVREALWRGGQQPNGGVSQRDGRPAARPAARVPATHAERVRALTAQPRATIRPWMLLAALVTALVVAGWSAAGLLAFQQPLWSSPANAEPADGGRRDQPAGTTPTTTAAPRTVAPTTTPPSTAKAGPVVASPASKGSGKPVPRVTGMQVEAAISRLAAAGTPAGTVWRRRSVDVPKDVVIQTVPPAGGHLLKGDKVVVVVSNGTDPDPAGTSQPAGGS